MVVIGVGVFFWLSYGNTSETGTPTNINVTLPGTNAEVTGTTDSE